MPNFDDISQSTAEIKLLPVSKTDGRHIGILFLVSILASVSSLACHFASASKLPSNRTIVGGVMTSYRIFKMAAI